MNGDTFRVPSTRRRRKAFTLLELIVVLLVLGILAVIAIPTFNTIQERATSGSLAAEAEALARNANAIAMSSGGVVTDAVLQSAVDESYNGDGPRASGGLVELERVTGNMQCRVVVASVSGRALAGEPSCTRDGTVPIAALPAPIDQIGSGPSGSGSSGSGSSGSGASNPGGFIPGSDATAAPIAVVSGLSVAPVKGNASALDVTWARPSATDVSGYNVYRTNPVSGVAELVYVTGPAATSVRLANLTSGVSYGVSVRAYNSLGEGPASAEVTGVPIGVPPALLTFTAGSNGQADVILSWTVDQTAANPTDTLALNVDGVPRTLLSRAEVDAGSFTLTGLTAGVSYTVSVTPSNAVGSAASSSQVVTAILAPAPVTGIVVAPVPGSNSSLDVSWNPISTSVESPSTGFNVYVQDSLMPFPQLWLVTGPDETSGVLTGLTPGVSYDVIVVAYNPAAEGVRPPATSGTPIGAPPPVSGITTTLIGTGDVSLSWTVTPEPPSPAAPITGFDIFVDAAKWASVPSSSRQYTISGLDLARTYTLSVTPTNGVGEAPPDPADTVEATPVLAPAAPTWVSGTSLTTTPTSVTIDWLSAPSSASAPVLGYHVYRKVGSGSYILVGTTDPATTVFTDTDVSPGLSYSYQVAAFNDSGDGTLTPEVTGITIQAPLAATSVAASSTSTGSIAVSWVSSPSTQRPVDTVTVRACTDSGFTTGCLTPLTPAASATSASFSGATPAATYYVRVDLANAAGSTSSTAATVRVAYAATLNSAYYSCPSGGSLSGTTCTTSVWIPQYYSCPSGGTLSGTTCTKSVYQALYCPAPGYSLVGSTCERQVWSYWSGSVGGLCSAISPKPATWTSWSYNSATRSCNYNAASYYIDYYPASGGYWYDTTYSATLNPGYYANSSYAATYNSAYYTCPSGGTLSGSTCRFN